MKNGIYFRSCTSIGAGYGIIQIVVSLSTVGMAYTTRARRVIGTRQCRVTAVIPINKI